MTSKKNHKWLFENSIVPYETIKARHAVSIKKKLFSGKSPFQKVEVFDSVSFGKILVLDGIFQTSERDEFIYHEMLCHLPMFYHQKPKRVLIIGGGDGGSLEEVLKHPVEKVWMVEIDKKVIDVSKKYLPSISRGAFNSSRAEVIVGDGLQFIKKYRNFFDVIILDLSDPWGPAKKLISVGFYKDIKRSMTKNGVVSVQSGSFTCQPRLVFIISQRLKKVFSSVKVHQASIPLYGIGVFSFTVASDHNLEKISLAKLKNRYKKLSFKTKYYYPEIQKSSRVLPKFLRDYLDI